MADTFGPIAVPLVPPTGGQPATEPLIRTFLDYLKAFLVNDQNASLAWQLPGVSPLQPPVVGTFAYDPQEVLFSSASLPALYCWRESGKENWIADDYLLEETQLKLLWVFPLSTPDNMAARTTFINGLVKAINIAIERGRTPSWVQPGDTDPVAASQGSFIGTYLGAWELWLASWRRTNMTERSKDGSFKAVYPALEMTFTLKEEWTVDINDATRFEPTSQLNGVGMTIENASGTAIVEGDLAGTPVVD